MYIDHSMLHAICHLGSSNLRLAVEPKRQIELLLLLSLRRYLLWLTMLMAFVHALCTRIGPPWQLQHTWIGVRSCAASTSFAMAARSCCTGATLLRFSIFPRTLTGCPSCQAFFRRCESQRVLPRIALVVRREGVGSSSRGSGPLPDGMCWWRPVYLRRWHGLELVPAAKACQLRRCVRPRPASRLTMWRRATSIDWWRCWQTSRSGATRVWLQPMIFGKCGGYGNKASDAGGNQHMSPWQGERQRSATLWPGQAAHYGFGWALSRQASRTSILLAQPEDSPLCSCATYATASCALIAPGRAELAALSRLALALLGAGLVLPSGTSVQTMDKDGLGSGPQALVAHWRAAHGVRLDEDFAFAFCSLEEATRDAGPEVAVAWQQARARSAEGDNLALVHAAALAGRQVSPASRPPLPRRYKPVPLHGRVRQQAAVGPPKEGITTAMIDELSAFLVDARCRRPRGELTYARQAEWEISVKRLVQNHTATAEAATFKNAIKTLQELYHFQILRGRAQGLEEVDPVDLDAFLHGGTTAPTRGLQALRWISKNAQLQWVLPELRRVKQPKAVGEQQAMVVEPPLLSHLEDRISAMCKAGDARWTALLGQWLVGVGVLRYKHLNLSTVLKITPSTVHCFCTKGKQAKLRQGFYWCVPATFSNSFAWTKPWVDQFLLLSPARRKHCGLVFDMRGRPWSRLESVRATQDEFRAVLEEPSLLTSYSWRRLGTTVGLLANFSVPQLAALGDWGDRISDTQAKMPVHYAGSRYALSRFCKHYAYYVASHVRDYTAWEVIPPPAVDEACRLAKDRAALAVEQDCTVVWSSPARSSLEPPRLRLTAAARDRVRKHSNAMAYSSQAVMPEVIGNKQAGPALRDGTVLCPQWNQGLCINGDACPVAHRCAAVYRSGRVCGGYHPALECRSPKVQWVNVHTTPAPKPPARKRGGTAEGVTPKRVRRGPEPADDTPPCQGVAPGEDGASGTGAGS